MIYSVLIIFLYVFAHDDSDDDRLACISPGTVAVCMVVVTDDGSVGGGGAGGDADAVVTIIGCS